MNKKQILPLLAVFSFVALSMFAALPVYAYEAYHGATTSWDRGDWGAAGGSASYDTSTGELAASSTGWAYMNSANVQAQADVDSISVIIWWTDADKYSFGGSYSFECKLYVNDEYQGIQYADYSTWNDDYQQFTFNGLDVDDGDSLDVDVKFEAAALSPWVAWIEADFSYVGFYTE
jgi:hypothetical protein